MKTLKSPLTFSMLFLALIILGTSVSAQTKEEKKAATTQLVEGNRYEFVAQSMSPQGGRLRQLTSYYFVKITADTVIADLPYVGRSYSAPINTSDVGINFTSTEFTYDVKPRKKGGWDVNIKPKDKPEVQQLQFTLYDNGSAYLQVISTNRQTISFNGDVQPIKEKKQK
jgi:hypothetical protein